MSLIQIEKEIETPATKQTHKASDILINATEKQCSGIRCKKVYGEKEYCALGLLGLYV